MDLNDLGLPGLKQRFNRAGLPVTAVHYTANPGRRSEEWKKQERRKYSSQAAWDREQEIVHEAGGGELIFRHILSQWASKIIISGEGLVISPFWTPLGGFDHGSANPTAALLGAVGDDGVIYLLGEYYQPHIPGGGIQAHIQSLKQLKWVNPPSAYDQITSKRFPGFAELPEVLADPSIFNKTQQSADGNLKSIADLYLENGLPNLAPAPNNAEIAGMERILAHWRDLEHREPTLKIVCPSYYNIEQKRFGLYTDGCPNLVWELRRARRAQLTAQQLLTKNHSEAIVDKDNHLRDCCLAAGTRVMTRRGEVSIEQVAVGDRVMTRRGWKRVTAAGMTAAHAEIWRARFSDGAELEGTAEHPVWVDGNGFLPLDGLKYGMLCVCRQRNMERPTSLNGWGSISIATPIVRIATSASTIATAVSTFTRWYGCLSIVAQFLRATTSITSMATRSTMMRPTWSPLGLKITSVCSAAASRVPQNRRNWPRCGNLLANGMHLLRAGRGIRSIVGGSSGRWLLKPASIAASTSVTGIGRRATYFARRRAERGGGTPTSSTSRLAPVKRAVLRSPTIGTTRRASVLANVRVVSVEKTSRRAAVYNLSVDDCPEFFANGILVHNCKYLALSLPEPADLPLELRIQKIVTAHQESPTNAMIQRKKLEAELVREAEPVFVGMRARAKSSMWRASKAGKHYGRI